MIWLFGCAVVLLTNLCVESFLIRKCTVPPSLPRVARCRVASVEESSTLDGKTVVVCGANGRIGSQVVRELLRNSGAKQVRAIVRSTDEVESYSRLSYEIGAEEAKGTITPVWVSREINFEGTVEMASYNLSKLVVLPGNLLDEPFVKTVLADVDSVVWCAASKPAFSFQGGVENFRNIFGPKYDGVVEAEGIALTAAALKQDLRRRGLGFPRQSEASQQPTSFVLLSCAREAPKQRQGEQLLADANLPSYAVVRSANFDDLASTLLSGDVGEQRTLETVLDTDDTGLNEKRISRMEVAEYLVSALVDEGVRNQCVGIFSKKAPIEPEK